MAWEDLQRQLATGVVWLRAQEVGAASGTLSMEQALLEAIVEIDSDPAGSQDAIDTLGAGGAMDYDDDGAVRPGKLQRLACIRTHFLGDGEDSPGLLDILRDAGPSVDEVLGSLPDSIEDD